MKYLILTKEGKIEYASNELPKEGILYTEKDYTVLKNPINPIFNFEKDEWEEEVEKNQEL